MRGALPHADGCSVAFLAPLLSYAAGTLISNTVQVQVKKEDQAFPPGWAETTERREYPSSHIIHVVQEGERKRAMESPSLKQWPQEAFGL